MKQYTYTILIFFLLGAFLLTACDDMISSGGRTPIDPGKSDIDEGFDYIDIYTRADLEAVANDLTGIYRLKNDIDLSESEFTPIGSPDTPFSGVFEGNNKTLRGITINRQNGSGSENQNLGLFAAIEKSVKIQNLTIENISITGYRYIGAVAGTVPSSAERGSITNVHVKGIDFTSDGFTGGLLGGSRYITISRSSSSGRFSLNGVYVGGIVGIIFEGVELRENYADVEITIESSGTTSTALVGYVGGLVGYMKGESTTILVENNYAIGTVRARTQYGVIGGLIGYVIHNADISNNYAALYILSASDVMGGLIGRVHMQLSGLGFKTSVENAYFRRQYAGGEYISLIGQEDSLEAGDIVITNFAEYTLELENILKNGTPVTQNDFVGFDFTDVWRLDEDGKWPTLQWQQ